MPYSLYREGDGAGDSGPMSDIARLDAGGVAERLHNEAPRLGWNVTVGSLGSRTYVAQDYWMTTPVTEIVMDETVDEERTVVFKTRSGSLYTWRAF